MTLPLPASFGPLPTYEFANGQVAKVFVSGTFAPFPTAGVGFDIEALGLLTDGERAAEQEAVKGRGRHLQSQLRGNEEARLQSHRQLAAQAERQAEWQTGDKHIPTCICFMKDILKQGPWHTLFRDNPSKAWHDSLLMCFIDTLTHDSSVIGVHGFICLSSRHSSGSVGPTH